MKKYEHLQTTRKISKNIDFRVDGLVLWLTRQPWKCSLACEVPHVCICAAASTTVSTLCRYVCWCLNDCMCKYGPVWLLLHLTSEYLVLRICVCALISFFFYYIQFRTRLRVCLCMRLYVYLCLVLDVILMFMHLCMHTPILVCPFVCLRALAYVMSVHAFVFMCVHVCVHVLVYDWAFVTLQLSYLVPRCEFSIPYSVKKSPPRVVGYNSLPRALIGTRIGGKASYKPPGAPCPLQDPAKKQKTCLIEPDFL